MHAIAFGNTSIGQKRAQNEDRFFVDNELGLFIVADGMGGHAAGDVAASIAVETAAAHVRRHSETLDRVRSGEESSATLKKLGEEALIEASSEVYRRATSDEGTPGMGCTTTLIIVAGGNAAVAHVGDTRAYLWRKGETHQLTNDHTLAADLARMGVIQWSEVESHSYAHVLSRAIGTQVAVTVETLLIDILPEDRFLICSDGLTAYTTGDTWFDKPLGAEDIDTIAEELVVFANESGGRDNITAVVAAIDLDDSERDTAPDLISVIEGRYDALSSVFLFKDLSIARRARVLDLCRLREFDADELIIAQGDEITALHVVIDGQLSIDRDGGALMELNTGDYVGAAALIRPRAARASLWSREPTQLLILEGEAFRELIRKRPWMGVDLLERLGGRLAFELNELFETLTSREELGTRGDRRGIL